MCMNANILRNKNIIRVSHDIIFPHQKKRPFTWICCFLKLHSKRLGWKIWTPPTLACFLPLRKKNLMQNSKLWAHPHRLHAYDVKAKSQSARGLLYITPAKFFDFFDPLPLLVRIFTQPPLIRPLFRDLPSPLDLGRHKWRLPYAIVEWQQEQVESHPMRAQRPNQWQRSDGGRGHAPIWIALSGQPIILRSAWNTLRNEKSELPFLHFHYHSVCGIFQRRKHKFTTSN